MPPNEPPYGHGFSLTQGFIQVVSETHHHSPRNFVFLCRFEVWVEKPLMIKNREKPIIETRYQRVVQTYELATFYNVLFLPYLRSISPRLERFNFTQR